MTMLLIDAGNSRLKWALAKFQNGLQAGAWSNQNVLNNEQVTREIFAGLSPPDHVIISNVAGDKMTQILQDACAAWSCNIKFVIAQQQQCGVLNTYQRPAQLGSDRWAALIAAWQRSQHFGAYMRGYGRHRVDRVDAWARIEQFGRGLGLGRRCHAEAPR